MAFSDAQITTLRAKLELPETADEAAIVAAINAVVDESLEEKPPAATADTPPVGAPAAPAPPQATTPTAPPPAQQPVAAGTMVIDASAWTEREERIKRLEAADAKRRVDERDQILGQAVQAGKFAPARVEHWKRLWDADPEGTREVVAGLTPNVVPIAAMGELGLGEDSIDEEFNHLFPPTPKGV